jgi:mersacidin/lichenicidin family type 2 lantibiotic
MTQHDIIRAWKDPAYRETLTSEQRAQVPDHPAGLLELSDSELGDASGGLSWWTTIIETVTESLRQFTAADCCDFFPKSVGPKAPQCPAKLKRRT